MAKKSIKDLDAELAALEAELQALEEGEAPPKPARKAKRAPEPAPAAEPHEAPEAQAEPAAPKRRLGLPKRAQPAPAQPEPEPQRAAEPEPAAPKRKLGLPKRAPKPAPPEAPPEPAPAVPVEPEVPPLPWEARGKAWAVAPERQRVEVLRRELDAQGRVVREEPVGEEVEGAPLAPEPEPERRFALLGGPPPEPSAQGKPPRRNRRRILLPLLVLLAILLVAGAWLALSGGNVGGGGGQVPTAAFRLSGNVAAIGSPLSFDGDPSADPSGGALEYDWDFGDGSGAQGKEVDHAYQARGTFTVTLTVRNSAGKTGTHSEPVTVLAPPSAAFALTLNGQPVGAANPAFNGTALAFDASASSADGGVSSYDWLFGDGARGSGKSATHAYVNPGAYNATLTVVDSNGLRGSVTHTVLVGSRIHLNGTVPASLQAATSANTTVQVLGHAAKLHAVLAFDANVTSGLPPGLPGLPGAVNPNNLGLTLFDPTGKAAGAGPADGSPKTADASNPAQGAWVVQVSRPQGGAQDEPYDLVVEVTYG